MWSMLMMSLVCFMFRSFSIWVICQLLSIFFVIWKLGKYTQKKVFFFDSLSLKMILLTNIMMFLCLMLYTKYELVALKFSLTLFFLMNKLVLFYMLFEVSIIPAFFMILGYGATPERMQALLYLMIYTVMGSFPLIYSFLNLYSNGIMGSLNLINFEKISNMKFLLFFSIFSFFMKLPLFGIHHWLPKAHVEAPTFGSMMLAALLLKMGSYGMFRLDFSKFMGKNNVFFSWILVSLMMVSFVCFRVKDMKKFMAFSSMNHMLMVAYSWLFLSYESLQFSFMLSMSHGFISSGLFLMVGTLYDFTHSRKVLFKTGHKMFSLMKFFWFMLLVANCSAPTSLSLFSEVMIFGHLVKENFSLFSIILYVFFTGLYCIFMYIQSFHSEFQNIFSVNKVSLSVYLSLMLHCIFSFFFIFWCIFII